MKLNEQVDLSFITKKTWTRDQFFKIFCGIMFGGICLFLLSLIVFGFERWRYLFFIFFDPNDSFMDFVNPISYSASFDLSYTYWHVIYPPLPTAVCTFLAKFCPSEFLNYFRAFYLRSSQVMISMLIMFFVISLSGIFSLLYYLKKGTAKIKLIFCILILFSFPFLYWFERANNVIFVLIFSMFFVAFYNHPKTIIRQLSLLALALAINIKIYPLVFGMLLLRDKKFKEILYLCIYTIILFFVPFIFVGNISSLKVYIKNITRHSGWFGNLCCGFGVSLNNVFTTLFTACTAKLPGEKLSQVFSTITLLAGFYGAFISYFIKDIWKTLAMLCLLIILIPQTSSDYSLIFMTIPLIFFLNKEDSYKFKDLMYLVLFAFIFMLNIPAKAPIIQNPAGYPTTISNLFAKISCTIMFIILSYDGLKNLLRSIMNLNKNIDLSFITKKTWTQNQFFKIFCGIMFGGICLFLLSLLILGFERWICLFHLVSDPTDSFMDFFNPIAWTGAANLQEAYLNNLNIYPPIVVLFAGILGSNFPEIFLGTMRWFGFLNYPSAMMLLSIFLLVSYISLFGLLWIKKIGNLKTKFLFCFFIMFSAPFLSWAERGNYIIFAVIFSLLFVLYYNSSKKYIKHLALFSLALAINIKVYPAVLGLLILKDKKFKDILFLGIYTALLFFVPLIWLGGIDSIHLWLYNLRYNTGVILNKGYGYLLSLSSTLKMLVYAIFRQEYPILNKIFFALSVLILPIGVLSSYFIRSKWKTLAILCLLMILIPQISYTYVLLFMIIPLLYFLNEKDKYDFCDLIYLILFCLVFMLNIPAMVPIYQPMKVNSVLMDNFCARLACLVIFVMLCIDGIKDCCMCLCEYKRSKLK